MEREKKSPEKNRAEKSPEKNQTDLISDLKTASEGLIYISETDAPFEPFVWKADKPSTEVTVPDVLKFAGQKSDVKIVEKTLDDFFRQPTEMQDWFGDEEKTQVEKYLKLKELLATKLKGVKVFKIGDVQIDVYIVGIDAEGNLAGVKTKAVET
jgi:hypothetical protein